jgi:hypothetical protein
MSVDSIRAGLDSQVAEPGTEGTRAERRAEMDRYLADCQAQIERLDEEHLLWLGGDRDAAVSMSHELVWSWDTATASRWWRALPERYMTPDSLKRPDWDHSHYPHDEHGRTGRVTTRQRPETEEDRQAAELVGKILAELEQERAHEKTGCRHCGE